MFKLWCRIFIKLLKCSNLVNTWSTSEFFTIIIILWSSRVHGSLTTVKVVLFSSYRYDTNQYFMSLYTSDLICYMIYWQKVLHEVSHLIYLHYQFQVDLCYDLLSMDGIYSLGSIVITMNLLFLIFSSCWFSLIWVAVVLLCVLLLPTTRRRS